VELHRKNRKYENRIDRVIPLDEYNKALKGEAYRLIRNKIDSLGSNYDGVIEFVRELHRGVKEEVVDYSFPLKKVVKKEEENLSLENEIIFNEKNSSKNFFKKLKEELLSCDEFVFVVSFIRFSGLQLLLPILNELNEKGVKGKILTSFYLNITDRKSLEKLMELENIEVKIYNSQNSSFHTKAYYFQRDERKSSLIVGSSNISKSAFYSGEEWSSKVSEYYNPEIIALSKDRFEKLWKSEEAYKLDEDLLLEYSNFLKEVEPQKLVNFFNRKKSSKKLLPNIMQEEILENLKNTRKLGHRKALVVSATGTGKTYLSAFDVRAEKPKKLLFIAHREELLENSISSYKKIMPKKNYGLLSGNRKEFQSEYLFSTIQSLTMDKNLFRFEKEEFDYIIIDEFHHSAADSYKKVIEYFKPKFLLGLTATPERMDGKDILELCDNNIVGDIRLNEALERELLSPFHYFGIADNSVNYDEIRAKNGRYVEKELSEALSLNKRVDFIIKKMKEYSFSGEKLNALGFCVDINHAKFMEESFNERGYRSRHLSANHSLAERREVIKLFEKGELDIIFTVNLFNEGIDIPRVNMLLFLRPTDSSTIFIQQLGRGLRKDESKEFVTVLDFIGNHTKSFIATSVFSDTYRDVLKNREFLKHKIEHEEWGHFQNSHIELERVCQKLILEKLDSLKKVTNSEVKEKYLELRNRYERPLKVSDFLEEKSLFKDLVKSYKSFIGAKKVVKDLSEMESKNLDNELFISYLARIDRMYPLKWPYDMILIKLLLDNEKITTSMVLEELGQFFNTEFRENYSSKIIHSFKDLSGLDKKGDLPFGKLEDNVFYIDDSFKKLLEDREIKAYIKEYIDFYMYTYKNNYNLEEIKNRINLYEDYSRIELQYIFESHMQKGSWRAGYAISKNDICLFITMNKEDGIKEELNYDNCFSNREIVQWISQNKTSHSSPIGKLFVNHNEMNHNVHIFIRNERVKNGETVDFTYLGKADYYSSSGDKPMYIKWKLRNKIPEDLLLKLTVN